MAPTPTPPTLSVAELILLFAGDELTSGYPTGELAAAICAQINDLPPTPYAAGRRLLHVIYGIPETGTLTGNDIIPDDEAQALDDGIQIFRERERLNQLLAA